MSRFERAVRHFHNCGLGMDPETCKTITHLLEIAHSAISTWEGGEGDLKAKDIAKIRRFINRWEPLRD